MYGLGDALQPDPPKDPKQAAVEKLFDAIKVCRDNGYMVAIQLGGLDKDDFTVMEYGPVKGFMKSLKLARAERAKQNK